MAYAEKSYGTEAAVDRSRPVVKEHLTTTRDCLISARDKLQFALGRLRGNVGLGESDPRVQPPEPDHIVFIGECNVRLANEVVSLASDLAEYI